MAKDWKLQERLKAYNVFDGIVSGRGVLNYGIINTCRTLFCFGAMMQNGIASNIK